MRRSFLVRSAAAGRGVFGAIAAAAIASWLPLIVVWQAAAEERVPGLTGIDRAGDVVQARQLLMAGIEDEMHSLDLAADGKDAPLDELKANAYRINIMLAAFPHLFPPQSKPSTAADAAPTSAAPDIWQDFDAFYGQSEAAAAAAYDASQAPAMDQLREHARKLRAACDGCHARYMRVEPPPHP